MKFKKGDQVVVTAGKDKGKEGTIDRVYKKQNKVLIQDINLYKKSIRPNEQMPQGGMVDLPRPISAANVMLKDPKSGKASRIGYDTSKDQKVRVAKKSGSQLK